MKNLVFIGSGPSVIFPLYEMLSSKKLKDYKITVIEQGLDIESRVCPSKNNKTACTKSCNHCAITTGIGGVGSFSDFKLPITTEFGGYLHELIGVEESLNYQYKVDSTLLKIAKSLHENLQFQLYGSNEKIKKLCYENGLKLLDANFRHFGSNYGLEIIKFVYKELQNYGVEFRLPLEVKDIEQSKVSRRYKVITDSEDFITDILVIAAGRSNSGWVKSVCDKLDIRTSNSKTDIGVRVELPHFVFRNITDTLYEGKIVYKTKQYEDEVRTFCMNPNGFIVNENTNGLITVNGYSNNSEYSNCEKSDMTNFALLVGQKFTKPFNDSSKYCSSICTLSNLLANGVMLQRFGDLISGRRSTGVRIKNNSFAPTLKAEPGDLSLVLPKRILDDIVETIYVLDKICPGTANPDTLLYGVEVKFYNTVVKMNSKLEIDNYENLYFIGDGSGQTHSLTQAAAMGLYLLEQL